MRTGVVLSQYAWIYYGILLGMDLGNTVSTEVIVAAAVVPVIVIIVAFLTIIFVVIICTRYKNRKQTDNEGNSAIINCYMNFLNIGVLWIIIQIIVVLSF